MSQSNPESAAEYMSKGPWRPSVEPDTYPSLEEIVGQAVGAGSVCWTSTPNGIFKSEQAKWIVEGAVESIRRTLKLEAPVAQFPYASNLGGHIIIGPECFSDAAEQNIMWKGQHFKATPERQDETLVMIQAAAAKHMFIALAENLPKAAEDALMEYLTRAFNAGYQSHADDIAAKVNQEGFDKWAADVETPPIAAECGMAEEPEEVKQVRRQRRQDQADLIDLILHYKNPADEETRMRQIRVVMD